MRYEDWDVIIFPEGSKVPIQEFKTQCFVTKDAPGAAYLQTHPYLHPSAFHMPTPVSHASLGQTPCLTTFIPGLEAGSAFRASVHNWTKPRPSRMTEGLMRPDDTVLFEVRVFIDGVCVL
ncbi:hypothetical protein KEM52_004512 [Ascosphaera acerosa]|nr:hypothetical protein KEM52_004512 [Ascosphaera acerosa]